MSDVVFRPLLPDDGAALSRFLSGIPDSDHRFLKEDITDPSAILNRWLVESRGRRLVGMCGDEMVAVVAAQPGTGWSSHVAELALILAPSHRRRGLGRSLARRALVLALECDCTHVYVEIVAEQEPLVSMFQELGFEPEALLRDFVRDWTGGSHDILLLTHRVEDHWGTMATFGVA